MAVTFDCEPKYSFYDLAEEQAEGELDRWVVEEALTVLPGNVAILPRPETAKQRRAVTPEVIGRVVDLLTDTYENVIIDMPRRIDPCTIAVMERADLVLVVCQLMVPSVGNAKRYLDMAAYARVPASNLEVLVNRYDSSGSLITLNDVERTIQKPIYGKIPNDYKSVSKFLDLGQPAVSLKAKNPVRAAMEVIAHKVAHGGANVSLAGAQSSLP